MKFVVAMPVHSNRPMYFEGGSADTSWRPDLFYGVHSRRVDAKRAYLLATKELVDRADYPYSDEFINNYFKHIARNQWAKIIQYDERTLELNDQRIPVQQ